MSVAVLIAGCVAVTVAVKGAGPVALGGRRLPGWFGQVVTLLAPALLAALVVTQALANGDRLAIGADTAGVAVAGLLLLRGASVITAVGVAAVIAAVLRAIA